MIIEKSIVLSIALVAGLSLNLTATVGTPQEAEIRMEERVLQPRFRELPSPRQGQVVTENPPVFLWPLSGNIGRGENPRYDFRLSQDPDFPEETTVLDADKRYAVHNPHSRLDSGMWYWQYKTSEQDEWSAIQSFQITDSAAVHETPSAKELFASIPETHPRILVADESVEAFRERAAGSEDARIILERAERSLSRPTPKAKDFDPDYSMARTEVEREKVEALVAKELTFSASLSVELFCQAYLLSGDERFARAAIEYANVIARWDPNGFSMLSNFGDSRCMLALAQVIDACSDLITDEERHAYLRSITVRGSRFYDIWTNMLESKVFSGHVWQHILEQLVKTSFITHGYIPEAEDWLEFCYEVWLARAPSLGPPDGGWWNGTGYMKLNGLTLLNVPLMLEHYTGVDFIRSEFYQNNPTWMIYSFPAKSYSQGFANGTATAVGQRLGTLGYVDALARLTQNPYASWYVDYQLAGTGRTLADDDEFRWFRLKWELPERPPAVERFDLPLARRFPDTGTVNMHTNIVEPEKNLMVSMRSSPYGSTSHAHADQNTFNVQYGGERVYLTSGYRPSMGVPHYTDWFKATIGHNSVLIDGIGQPIGVGESYGWLPRFLHGDRISYSLGDASKAYDNEIESPQIAGLTRFRRHLVFLRPDIIVIYDELAADHEADWSWLLHSAMPIAIDTGSVSLECVTGNARSQVKFFGSSELGIELSTEFDPKPPANYMKKRDDEGNLRDFPDQWHVTVKARAETMRYLSVIQVVPKEGFSGYHEVKELGNGHLAVGDWKIRAGLQADAPPWFEITNGSSNRGLMYNRPTLNVGGRSFEPEHRGSTLLVEPVNGKLTATEAIDELPTWVQ